MREVIIVGAGLSGLSAAYYLKKEGVKPLLIEARERTGGRILTLAAEGKATPLEMGATWCNDNHLHLLSLLKELELPVFTQHQKGIGLYEASVSAEAQLFEIPTTVEPSYRIAGGSSTLIDKLVEHIGRDQLVFESPIAKVLEQNNHIELTSKQGEKFTCRNLIITIPPYLLISQQIYFNPVLPSDLIHVLENTHTWMGEAVKFALEYEQPFWRKQGYAGLVMSHAGIAQEIHDHCNVEGTRFALKGFLAAEAITLNSKKREAAVVEQLRRLFGNEALCYLSYSEKLWMDEAYTYADYKNAVRPHQNNGHPLYARVLMNGKLYLAGTETSPYFGGYLDGAVYSGLAAAKKVLLRMNSLA